VAPVGKFTDTVGVFPPDVFRGLEFDQAAQRVSGKLSEQTPLGPGEHRFIRKGPGHRSAHLFISANTPQPRYSRVETA
jgi:hypothetical protein